MANEIQVAYTQARTIIAHVENASTLVTTNVTLTEASAGLYVGNFPGVAAGTYNLTFYDGATLLQGSGTIVWDGTKEVLASSSIDPANGSLILVAGDDYKGADGRAFSITATGFPSLAGAAVTWIATCVDDGTTGFEVAGTVSGTANVSFELTHSQTASLWQGEDRYRYCMKATLGSGDILTIQTGTISVL